MSSTSTPPPVDGRAGRGQVEVMEGPDRDIGVGMSASASSSSSSSASSSAFRVRTADAAKEEVKSQHVGSSPSGRSSPPSSRASSLHTRTGDGGAPNGTQDETSEKDQASDKQHKSAHEDDVGMDIEKSAEAPNAASSEKSEEPYSIFSKRERWTIIIIITLAGFFSPLTANIYLPAIPAVAQDLRESTEKINLSVTIFMIFQGISPLFFGSMTDTLGRRPIYIFCLVLFALSNIGLWCLPHISEAHSSSAVYAGLLVLRAIQACGSASVISIGSGSIGDITLPADRGGVMGVFQSGTSIGPSLGPVLGGLLAARFGWRSIFLFLFILTIVSLVLLVFFLPETLRKLVGNGSKPPPTIFHESLYKILLRRTITQRTGVKRPGRLPPFPSRPGESSTSRFARRLLQPFSPLQFLAMPEVLAVLLANAIPYTAYYMVTSTIAFAFQERYGFTTLQGALVFIAPGVGTSIAAFTSGCILDRSYKTVETLYWEAKGRDDSHVAYRCVCIDFIASLLRSPWNALTGRRRRTEGAQQDDAVQPESPSRQQAQQDDGQDPPPVDDVSIGETVHSAASPSIKEDESHHKTEDKGREMDSSGTDSIEVLHPEEKDPGEQRTAAAATTATAEVDLQAPCAISMIHKASSKRTASNVQSPAVSPEDQSLDHTLRLDKKADTSGLRKRKSTLLRQPSPPIRKLNPEDLRDFPIENARFRAYPPMMVLLVTSLIAYGWTLDKGVHPSAPIIFTFVIGYAVGSFFSIFGCILVDYLPGRGAGVTAANNLVRCLCGAGGTAVIQFIYNALGPGLTFTVVALFTLASSPIVVLAYYKGPKWRKARYEAKQDKIAARTQAAEGSLSAAK